MLCWSLPKFQVPLQAPLPCCHTLTHPLPKPAARILPCWLASMHVTLLSCRLHSCHGIPSCDKLKIEAHTHSGTHTLIHTLRCLRAHSAVIRRSIYKKCAGGAAPQCIRISVGLRCAAGASKVSRERNGCWHAMLLICFKCICICCGTHRTGVYKRSLRVAREFIRLYVYVSAYVNVVAVPDPQD